MGQPVTTDPSLESIENAFADAVRQVMDALLSRNEAPLPEGGVRGVGGFAEAFVAQAAREGKPSLKELDLTRRLFKYRCSYQVQSAAFENMQPALRKRVLRWLSRVLSESGSDRRYAYLEPEERANIRRILLETVPGFR